MPWEGSGSTVLAKRVLKSPSLTQPSQTQTKSRFQPAGGAAGAAKRNAISSPAFMMT